MSAQTLPLARVLLGFAIAYIAVPMLVLPRPRSAETLLDAIVANFVRWVAIVAVLSHALALLGRYSPVSLALGILAVGWVARWRTTLGGVSGLLHRLWPGEHDRAAHANRNEREGRRQADKPRGTRPGATLRRRLAAVPTALPALALLITAYWLRVRDVVGSLRLSPPDAYLHMHWLSLLREGVIWPDGVYPQGMTAFAGLWWWTTPATPVLDFTRYAGTLGGLLPMAAVAYAAYRLTRNPGAALLAGAALGLFGVNPQWRQPWERQVTLLPMEFGVALAVAGLVFGVLAVTRGWHERTTGDSRVARLMGTSDTITLAAAGFGVAMAHPIPAVAFVGLLACGCGAAALAMRNRRAVHAAVRTVAVGTGAALTGIAVVPIAELLGARPYLGYGAGAALADAASTSGSRAATLLRYFGEPAMLGHSWLSVLAGVLALLGLLAGSRLALRGTRRAPGAELTALSAMGLVVVLIWDLRALSLRVEPFYVARLANVLGALLPLALAAGLGVLTPLVSASPSRTRLTAVTLSGVLAVGALAGRFPADALDRFYQRELIEYEEMAEVTQRIVAGHDPHTYTIAGLTHQEQAMGRRGRFISLWVFARDAPSVPHDELLPVPTPDTYVFVELDPFPIRPIEARGPTEEYYFDPTKRGRIMARVLAWAEERRARNTDTSVYHDGEHVRVYRISRNPAIQPPRDTREFTDYRWRRGALFTSGPARPREVEAR